MDAPSGDPVPAIREDLATGEIARLYADIRQTLGVQVVNLIWRHVATYPGALAWTWTAVKPLYASGAATAAAAALRQRLALPDLPRLSRTALRAVGIGEREEGAILTVLDSYNRSNAVNMAALTALLLKLDGTIATATAPVCLIETAEEPLGALPALLSLADMAPQTARLVGEIDRLGARPDDQVLASMYRHLAHWPGFLALACTFLAPLAADGRIADAIRASIAAGRVEGAALLGQLGAPAALPPEVHVQTRAAIAMFVRGPIGRMVPICALLRRAMPAA